LRIFHSATSRSTVPIQARTSDDDI
jgi:hypothetical protein